MKLLWSSWSRFRPFGRANSMIGRRYNSGKVCDPLRILFCGSDGFSGASLTALHNEYVNRPESNIASIDVVCRPGKRTGRGLKVIREGEWIMKLDTFQCMN